jgi:hypothetical protein
MLKLFAVALVLTGALGFAPAFAHCGPAHSCEGAYCES